MLTPLPRVTKPLMASGGAGLQHLDNWVSNESTPTTSTPDCDLGGTTRDFLSKHKIIGVHHGFWRPQEDLDVAQGKLILAHRFKQGLRRFESQI